MSPTCECPACGTVWRVPKYISSLYVNAKRMNNRGKILENICPKCREVQQMRSGEKFVEPTPKQQDFDDLEDSQLWDQLTSG